MLDIFWNACKVGTLRRSDGRNSCTTQSMKKILLSCSCLAIALCCAAPHLQAKGEAAKVGDAKKRHHKKGKAPTPVSVVADMRAAVAFIAVEAKKDLNAKSKQERPFWAGLKLASESLDKMEKGIKAKDASMLTGLEGVGRGVEMVGTSWGVLRGGEKASKVGRGVLALHGAYEFFETHYGPVAARHKKGGSISAAEKASFAKAQAEQKKLKGSLTKLQAGAGKNTLQGRMVIDLLRQLAALADLSADSVDHYCSYMHHWNRFETTFYAYNDCIEVWYPEFYASWKTVYTEYAVVRTIFASASSSYYTGWDYTSDAVESYGDYYESTVSVERSEITSSESYVESYEESSATEEVASQEEELEAEYSTSEDEEESFADAAMDDSDDADGDGVSDEEDADDDNDGVADEADTDDDGDGVSDEEDTDMDENADEDSDDSDDDGIADDDDTDDDNDGTMDADDGDDDGDGVDDADDGGDDAGDGGEE